MDRRSPRNGPQLLGKRRKTMNLRNNLMRWLILALALSAFAATAAQAGPRPNDRAGTLGVGSPLIAGDTSDVVSRYLRSHATRPDDRARFAWSQQRGCAVAGRVRAICKCASIRRRARGDVGCGSCRIPVGRLRCRRRNRDRAGSAARRRLDRNTNVASAAQAARCRLMKPSSIPDPASGLAGALVAGDFERLTAMLAADVRMRALTPPGLVELSGAVAT